MTPRQALPPIQWIESTRALQQLVGDLQTIPLIALDTESNSSFAYYEQVCLIQLSTRHADYIIDPIAIDNLSALNAITADPRIEKILHAGEHDIAALKRDFDLQFVNVFDTMHGARILGVEKVGLSKMLRHQFGIQQDTRYQRIDWSQRPLNEDMIHYARLDTHYLPALRDLIADELKAVGAWEEAQEIFRELCHATATPPSFDEHGFWRFKTPNSFSKRDWAILRELYLWREQTAQALDIAPYRILTGEKMVQLSQMRIYSKGDLYKVKILSKYERQRYGKEILRALERGRKAALPSRPRSRPRNHLTAAYQEELKQWRKQRAIERGVDSDIILPPDKLLDIARLRPQTLEELKPLLGPWRIQTYGQEILSVVSGG